MANSTFCIAFIEGMRVTDWKTNPICLLLIFSLALLLLLKFAVFPRVCPGGARTWEMVAGVGVPFLLLSIFEIRGRSPKGL